MRSRDIAGFSHAPMPNPTARIDVLDGVVVPAELLPSPDSCGLDLWCSPLAESWIGATLGARAMTIDIEHEGRSARLVLWRRPLLPGITLASGYPYAAILGDAGVFWERFDDVRARLRRLGVARMELALSGDHIQSCLTPAAYSHISRQYLEKLHATRQVVGFAPFRSVEDMERSYPGNLRWSIRKAIQEGVAVSPANADEADLAQALYEETMREKGAPVYYDAQRFRLLAQGAERPPIGRLYLAQHGATPLGMAAVADSQSTRHLVQLAVPRRFHKSRAADLLVATTMRDAFAAGKKYFDFMATSRADTGLAQFKAKWGGVTEDIAYATVPIQPLRSRLVDWLRYGSRFWAAWNARRVRRGDVSHEPND